MKEKVGIVSVQEKDEIKALFERKNALVELIRIIDVSNEPLYEKIVKDFGETTAKFQNWWDEKSVYYNWKKIDNANWEINFGTCEIYLAVI